MPDGTSRSFRCCPPARMVWPAFVPPWQRTTTSDRPASRSVAFPLPSSPHWDPTRMVSGTARFYRPKPVELPTWPRTYTPVDDTPRDPGRDPLLLAGPASGEKGLRSGAERRPPLQAEEPGHRPGTRTHPGVEVTLTAR